MPGKGLATRRVERHHDRAGRGAREGSRVPSRGAARNSARAIGPCHVPVEELVLRLRLRQERKGLSNCAGEQGQGDTRRRTWCNGELGGRVASVNGSSQAKHKSAVDVVMLVAKSSRTRTKVDSEQRTVFELKSGRKGGRQGNGCRRRLSGQRKRRTAADDAGGKNRE